MNLLPCPFCDSDDLEIITSPKKRSWVKCCDCMARGPRDWNDKDAAAEWNETCEKIVLLEKQVAEMRQLLSDDAREAMLPRERFEAEKNARTII